MASIFRESRSKQYGGMSTYDRDLSLNYLRNQSSMNRDASESSEEELLPEKKKKSRKKRKSSSLIANLSLTRYDIIRVVAEKYGFTVSKDDDAQNSFLIWSDSFVSNERVTELKSFQRINHFPGMGEICRKDYLARNMAKMSKVHPDEYNFVPRTWLMPQEHSQFLSYLKELRKKNKKKTFIIKPANGSMGNGIRLMQSTDAVPQLDNAILQEYIDKPFLVDGYKCDMRIYVLVTSCDPLRVFLYDEGLLRLSTQPYIHPNDSNLATGNNEPKTKKDTLYMHLTNYSVNKRSGNYLKSESDSTGSKRSLRFLNEHLRNHYDIKTLWRNIIDLIIKTMIVVEPHLLHAYRMCRPAQIPGSDSVCFEILGFDILLDRKLRPWLLEVNRSPSFGTDEKIDKDTKSMLLLDTFKLINIKVSDKRRDMAEQKALTQRRLLQNLHPKHEYFGDLDLMKKQKSMVKKKELLQDMLARNRREASREEYERQNGGRYRRIFPPDDRLRSEKFAKIMVSAFATFSNTNLMIQKEIEATYEKRLGEHEILEMLAEFEEEEKALWKSPQEPEGSDRAARSAPAGSSRSGLSRGSEHNSPSSTGSNRNGARSGVPSRRRNRSRASMQGSAEVPATPPDPAADDPAAKTLNMLSELSIKFPGRTEEEAEELLENIYDKWPQHKTDVAKYWLVKLDSAKRVKVLNIVRTNVSCILQRAYCSAEVDHLRLARLFTRVFNRLLWSNGQGLWECFNTQGFTLTTSPENIHSSWETMLCKSSDSITPLELSCCRRIVDLCKDCLLTVYQYATESTGKRPSALLGDKDLDATITISPHRQRT